MQVIANVSGSLL